MRSNVSSRISKVVLSLGLVFISACAFGPGRLKATSIEYNKAVRQTRDQELLLNLVRLKYREMPVFLELVSLSSQFTLSTSASVLGTIHENVTETNIPNILDLGGGISYDSRPTITFSPLRGEDFVQRLMSPLGLDTIAALYYSGWSIDRILRLTVQKINDVENAMSAAGPTPLKAPRYKKFQELTENLRDLQTRGVLEIGRTARSMTIGGTISEDKITGADVVNAANSGYRFERTGGGFALTRTEPVTVLQISQRAYEDEEMTAIVKSVFEIVFKREAAEAAGLKKIREIEVYEKIGEASGEGSEDTQYTLAVVPRSLIGVFFYLSQSVEAPKKHIKMNLVTQTETEDGELFDWSLVTKDLFRVRSSKLRPRGAAVAVPYRGYWFYIDDDDLNSKSTFALLGQLLSLKSGNAESAGPVLTLSVGQ